MPPENISEADFRTLGIAPGSEQSEVKRAYRSLAKKWHPDRHHSKPFEVRALAEERFKQINEAYKRITGNRNGQGGASERIRTAPSAKRSPTEASEPKPARVLKKRYRDVRFGQVIPVFALMILVFWLGYQLLSVFLQPSVETRTVPLPIFSDNRKNPDAESSQPIDSKEITEMLSELSKPAPTPPVPLLQPSEPVSTHFTIGSTSDEVLLVQGPPARIHGQTWVYDLSEIQFKNGRVWRYNNFDGSLKVVMLPNTAAEPAPAYITLGSTRDEVLLVQGTPSRVEQDKWFYGFAEIRFKDGLLREYDNYFGTLKVRLIPSVPAGQDEKRTFFTVGSSPDEVLALQGTPTSVHGTHWSYDFSSVFFLDGKVHYVTNSDGALRFLSREESAKSSGW